MGKHAASTPQARRRTADEHPAQLALGGDVVAMALVLGVSMLVSAGLLQNQLVALMPAAGKTGVRALLSALFYLFELIALSYIAYRHQQPFGIFFRIKPSDDVHMREAEGEPLPWSWWQSILAVLIALVALRALGIGWNLLTDAIGWHAPVVGQLVGVFGATRLGRVLAVINVAIFAPVVEEMTFRGLFQRWLVRRTGAVAGVLLTAAAFSFYHLSLWAALLNFALGVATGLLARRARTLWPAIVLHMLYNATLLAAAFYLAA